MALKAKFRTLFPALVSAVSPLTLVKAGLSYTFGLDINALEATLNANYTPLLFTQTGTNAIPYAIPDKLSQDFSLKDFGANTASSNNSTILQSAINAAAVAGSALHIPYGTFSCADPVTNNSGVRIYGEGTLSYTGTGTFITVAGSNLSSVNVSGLRLSATDTVSAVLMKFSGIGGGLSIHGNRFSGGKRSVQIVGTIGTGTYGVFIYNNNFEGNATTTICIDIAPTTTGYAQAIQIAFNTFSGYEQAIKHSGGDGVAIFGNRIERHIAATSAAIHTDTSNGVTISGNYFEDEANQPQIESGSNVGTLNISANNFYLNVAGGTKTSANAYVALAAASKVVISDNYVQSLSASSIVGKIFDTAASPVYGRSNTFNIGTASYGFASTATAANVDIDGTKVIAGTFSSAVRQVGVDRMASDLSNYTPGLTGSGKAVLQTSPILITPVLGDATGHSLALSDAGVSPGGIALGATALVSNLHGAINFDALGALYTNGAAAITFNTVGVALAGAPTAATAAVDTNTTQIASTAFVLAQAASATPQINGTAAVGTSTRYARADHVHQTKQLLGYASANTGAGAGSTGYFTNNFAAGEAAVQIPMAMAGTLKNVYIKSNGAPGGAETFTITLRKNNADTAITATITGAGTTASDLTHTVAYAAGDLFAVKVVGSGGAAAAGFSVGMEFDPS